MVFPEQAGTALMHEVNSLLSVIREYTGADLASRDDYIGRNRQEQEYEILIGHTNRAQSGACLQTLRMGEYTVCVSGSKLVVCGSNDDATANAVGWLIRQIRETGGLFRGCTNGTLTFSEEQNYRKTGSFYIQSLQIGGVGVEQFRLVFPEKGYTERYVALLFARYLQVYTGYTPEVISDVSEQTGAEFRIGRTNRGTACGDGPAGQYRICVTDGGMEAVSDSAWGYLAVLEALQQDVMPGTEAHISLSAGDCWSGAYTMPDTGRKAGLRILYHNVWGYLNADGSNPMANRSELLIPVYQTCFPDVLCLQEAGPYYRAGSSAMLAWLGEHYTEICYAAQGGSGNPVFYNPQVLEAVESGYVKSRNGDKGTTWVVFRQISTGSLFAVTNSHFAADTNAGGDAGLGNTYRVQDAEAAVRAGEAILQKYGEIPVFSGGDFNCMAGSDPYQAFLNAGYENVRDLAQESDSRSPYHGSFAYDAEFGIYPLQTSLPYRAEYAIDHIMKYGGAAEIACYCVLSDALALTGSDHAPHLIDIDLGENSD